MLVLTPFLPQELYFILDIIWLASKFKFEKQHRQKFPREFFHITDPNVFSDLAHIEYALFDKTGTLTESEPIVSTIFFNGKIYNLENSKTLGSFGTTKGSSNAGVVNTESFEKSIMEKEKISLIPHDKKEEVEVNEIFVSDQDIDSLLEKNIQNLAFLTCRCKFLDEESKVDLRKASSSVDLEKNDKRFLSASKELAYVENMEVDNNHEEFKEERKTSQKITQTNSLKRFDIEPEPSISETSPAKTNSKIILYNPTVKDLDEEYFKVEEIYNEQVLLDDAKKNQLKFFSLFEAFALCHHSFPRMDYKTGNNIFISQDRESEILLRFCAGCGFKFEKSHRHENPEWYVLNFNAQKQLKYKILGIIDFSATRKVFSIIYQNPSTKEYILVAKGHESAIKSKLQMAHSDNEKLSLLMKNMAKQGLTPIIFGCKTLEPGEAISFSKKIMNLKSSLINQRDQLEELAGEIETNLQLLSIVGFKESIKPEAVKMIEFLQSVDIKPCILTGDVKEKALGVSLKLKLIGQEKEALLIETNKKEDLVLEIRNILSILKANSSNYEKSQVDVSNINKKKNKPMNNFDYHSEKHFLLINGESLNIIEKDPYMAPHLAFICLLVKTVIGFNLSPWNKRLLARIIKKKFPRRPMVMAIGDGYNDILMLQTADVGVEIVNNAGEQRFEPIIMAGDIKISNLSQLQEVMTQESLSHSEILIDVIYFTCHKSILLGLQIFLFSFYCQFSEVPFQNSLLIFLYYFYFTLPLQIVYALQYSKFDKNVIQKIPELYIHGIFIKRKRQQKKLIVGMVLEGIFSGLIVFYLSVYVVNDSVSNQGMTNDLNLQSLSCFYGCMALHSSRILLKVMSQMKRVSAIFLCILLFVMLAAFLLIEEEKNLTGIFVGRNTLEFVSQFSIIMNFFYGIIVSIFSQLFMRYFFFQKWFPNPYDQVVRYMKRGANFDLGKVNSFLRRVVTKKM